MLTMALTTNFHIEGIKAECYSNLKSISFWKTTKQIQTKNFEGKAEENENEVCNRSFCCFGCLFFARYVFQWCNHLENCLVNM